MLKDKNDNAFEVVRKYFADYLVKSGYRKTPERFSILKEIYTFNGHFDIETLYLRMKKSKYLVSRATLYNTIELLLDCKLVTKHQFGENSAIYEKCFNFKQHDHIIMLDTNEILEFCEPRIQEIKKSLEQIFNITIKEHSLTFYAEYNKKTTENNE